MELSKDLSLASLKIPNLPVLIEEAFAVLSWQSGDSSEKVEDWTIEYLASRADMPIEAVVKKLQRMKALAFGIEIRCDALYAQLATHAKDWFLLDVREPWEWKICHIEGSQLMAHLDLAQIFEGLKELHVVTICHHGIRSMSAAFYLKEAGLPHVVSLKGGLHQWSLDIDQTMKRY